MKYKGEEHICNFYYPMVDVGSVDSRGKENQYCIMIRSIFFFENGIYACIFFILYNVHTISSIRM